METESKSKSLRRAAHNFGENDIEVEKVLSIVRESTVLPAVLVLRRASVPAFKTYDESFSSPP